MYATQTMHTPNTAPTYHKAVIVRKADDIKTPIEELKELHGDKIPAHLWGANMVTWVAHYAALAIFCAANRKKHGKLPEEWSARRQVLLQVIQVCINKLFNIGTKDLQAKRAPQDDLDRAFDSIRGSKLVWYFQPPLFKREPVTEAMSEIPYFAVSAKKPTTPKNNGAPIAPAWKPGEREALRTAIYKAVNEVALVGQPTFITYAEMQRITELVMKETEPGMSTTSIMAVFANMATTRFANYKAEQDPEGKLMARILILRDAAGLSQAELEGAAKQLREQRAAEQRAEAARRAVANFGACTKAPQPKKAKEEKGKNKKDGKK